MSKEQSIEEAAQELFDRGSYKNDGQLQSCYLAGARFGAEWSEQSKWIPVEERLPEITARYLIIFDNGFYAVCQYTNGWNYDGRRVITHWQPLPNPPKQ